MDVTSPARQGAPTSAAPTTVSSSASAGSNAAGHGAVGQGTTTKPFAVVLGNVKGGRRPSLVLVERGAAARPGFLGGGEAHPARGEAVRPREGAPEDGSGSGSGGGGDGDAAGETAKDAAPKTRDDMSDWLDPAARHAASLAPPLTSAPAQVEPASAETAMRARSLEELLPALVRRIAWAGDRHRGTVRLELGAGAFAGTTVVVHADAGRVRVEIGGREGPDLDRLRARLDARLRGQGLDVESVT